MVKLKKAFTIVELVIVIAVIGVLSAILIPVFSSIINKARQTTVMEDARSVFLSIVVENQEEEIPDNSVIAISKNGTVFYIEKQNNKFVMVQKSDIESTLINPLCLLVSDNAYSSGVGNQATLDIFLDAGYENPTITEIGSNYMVKDIDAHHYSSLNPNIVVFVKGSGVVYTRGLSFISNNDGTCYVSGLGDCIRTSIEIPSTSPDGDTVVEIGEKAFFSDENEKCNNIVNIVIPETVITIGSSAFRNCSGLASITIPGSVEKIGAKSFMGCTNLKSIKILEKSPEETGLTTIEERAFENCDSLESIEIPDTVTTIEDGAFNDCDNLSEEFKETIEEMAESETMNMGENLFDMKDIEVEYSEEEGITEIEDNAYENCETIETIVIPEGITNIGDYAFYNCKNLQGITLPKTITGIGKSAFEGCEKLATITITLENGESNILRIDDCAFKNCKLLTNVSVPNSVIAMGINVFEGCEQLTTISTPAITEGMFYGCTELANLTILQSTTSINVQAFRDCRLEQISVFNNTNYTVISNCLIEVSTNKLILSASGNQSVPIGINIIGEYAFRNCDISLVATSDTVTKIDKYAFLNCEQLETVTISNSVTIIEEGAFKDCGNLEYFYYTGTVEEWAEISFGENWRQNSGITSVICSNGNIDF